MSVMFKKQTGFTIVELLIVIVVITILAATSVVAYRGINARAVTASYTSAAEQWYRYLEAERALTGRLPTASGNFICLGSAATDFPVADGFAAGECANTTTGGWPRSYSETFMNSLQMSAGRPSGRLPVSTYEHSGGTVFRARGILLLPVSTGYTIRWFPQVAGQCGKGVPSGGKEAGLLTGDSCDITVTYN